MCRLESEQSNASVIYQQNVSSRQNLIPTLMIPVVNSWTTEQVSRNFSANAYKKNLADQEVPGVLRSIRFQKNESKSDPD